MTVTPITATTFSSDGRVLVTGGGDGTARLWDVNTRQQLGVPLTTPGAVKAVALSADDTMLATGSDDGTARLWNVGYLRDPAAFLCGELPVPFTRDGWDREVTAGPAYRNLC